MKPSSRRKRSISEQCLELKESLSLSSVANMSQPLPLHVTLSSLVGRPFDKTGRPLRGMGNRVLVLAALCHDTTSRVRHLRDNLAIIFAAATLFDESLLSVSFQADSVWLPQVGLINMAYVRGNLVPSPTQPGKFKTQYPEIDPRDLTPTFKDFVWAENIRLEMLSICPLGLYKQIRREGPNAQLSEMCSVPL